MLFLDCVKPKKGMSLFKVHIWFHFEGKYFKNSAKSYSFTCSQIIMPLVNWCNNTHNNAELWPFIFTVSLSLPAFYFTFAQTDVQRAFLNFSAQMVYSLDAIWWWKLTFWIGRLFPFGNISESETFLGIIWWLNDDSLISNSEEIL